MGMKNIKDRHHRRSYLAVLLCGLSSCSAFFMAPSSPPCPHIIATSAAFEWSHQPELSGRGFTLELSSAEELDDILRYLERDVQTKADAARQEEVDGSTGSEGRTSCISQEDMVLEVESFWHHRDDISLGLGTCLSSIKKRGVLVGFILISTNGKKMDLLEVFRPRRGEGAGRFAVESFEESRISEGAVVLSICSLAGSAGFWQARGYEPLPHAVGGPRGMLFKFPELTVNPRWKEVRLEGLPWRTVQLGIRVAMGDNLHGGGSRGRQLGEVIHLQALMRQEEGGMMEVVPQYVYVCACYPFDVMAITVDGVMVLEASLRRMASATVSSSSVCFGVEVEVGYVYSLRTLYVPQEGPGTLQERTVNKGEI